MTNTFEKYPDLPTEIPVGKWIIVQYPLTNHRSKSGKIILVADTVEADAFRETEAKVVAIGPLAFMKPDGTPVSDRENFFYVGDILRVPEYGNHNWQYKLDENNNVRFGAFDATQIITIKEPTQDRPDWETYRRDYRFGEKIAKGE